MANSLLDSRPYSNEIIGFIDDGNMFTSVDIPQKQQTTTTPESLIWVMTRNYRLEVQIDKKKHVIVLSLIPMYLQQSNKNEEKYCESESLNREIELTNQIQQNKINPLVLFQIIIESRNYLPVLYPILCQYFVDNWKQIINQSYEKVYENLIKYVLFNSNFLPYCIKVDHLSEMLYALLSSSQNETKPLRDLLFRIFYFRERKNTDSQLNNSGEMILQGSAKAEDLHKYLQHLASAGNTDKNLHLINETTRQELSQKTKTSNWRNLAGATLVTSLVGAGAFASHNRMKSHHEEDMEEEGEEANEKDVDDITEVSPPTSSKKLSHSSTKTSDTDDEEDDHNIHSNLLTAKGAKNELKKQHEENDHEKDENEDENEKDD